LLTNGKGEALVDDEDFQYLSQFKWCMQDKYYAKRYVSSRTVNGKQSCKYMQMHREIMNAPDGVQIDHINHNKLDNRKENLRFATAGQNSSNRAKRKTKSSSPFKGVSWCNRLKRWKAGIKVKNKSIHLGYHFCPVEAAKAYNDAALKYKEGYDWLNPI